MLAGVAAATLVFATAGVRPGLAQDAGQGSPDAGSPSPDAGTPAPKKPCKCEDLRKYLEMVKKKKECYEKAYQKHRTMDKPWTTKQQMNTEFIPDCMGWGAAKNIGIQSNATQDQQNQAKDECTADYCDWICRVSINTVHEPGHDWYDQTVKLNEFVLLGNAAIGRSGVVVMRNFIQREIAGHTSEVQFLEETLDESERNGKCDDVRRTIDQKELDDLWKFGLRRAQKYVDTLP